MDTSPSQLPSPDHLKTQTWFTNLAPEVQDAAFLSLQLLDREKDTHTTFTDYSFILFPIGKAYEGFLKQLLLEFHLINSITYNSKKFRIGRSLNPDISFAQRDKWWLYDDLARNCGPEVARAIWNVWITCRNQVFHYFPERKNTLSLTEVEKRMKTVFEVFEMVCHARKST